MKKTCKTQKEFVNAMKEKADYIQIEGDFANKVIRIKLVGKYAWALCIGALTTAIALILAAPSASVATAPAAGAGGAISFTGGLAAASAAVPVLGSATVTAVSIGVAAGGVGILTTLRNQYRIIEKRNNYVALQRK